MAQRTQQRQLTRLNFFTDRRKKLMLGIILGGAIIGIAFLAFSKAATDCVDGLCHVTGFSINYQGNQFVSDDYVIPLDNAETAGWVNKNDNLDIRVFSYQAPGTVSLLRLYQPALSQHFFTTDQNEINTYINTANVFGKGTGQQQENSGIFVFPSQAADTIPVYRVFNPTSNSFFYTTIRANADFLVNSQGYTGAGGVTVAFYAYPGTYQSSAEKQKAADAAAAAAAAAATAQVTTPAAAGSSCPALPLTASDWDFRAESADCMKQAQAKLKVPQTGVYDEATRLAWRAVAPYAPGATDDPRNAICPGADATDAKIAALPQPSLCILYIQRAIPNFNHALNGKWDAATQAGWRKLHPVQTAAADTQTYGAGTIPAEVVTPSSKKAIAVTPASKKTAGSTVVKANEPSISVGSGTTANCPSVNTGSVAQWKAASSYCIRVLQTFIGVKADGKWGPQTESKFVTSQTAANPNGGQTATNRSDTAQASKDAAAAKTQAGAPSIPVTKDYSCYISWESERKFFVGLGAWDFHSVRLSLPAPTDANNAGTQCKKKFEDFKKDNKYFYWHELSNGGQWETTDWQHKPVRNVNMELVYPK